MEHNFTIGILVILSILLGSFYNALIYRIPRHLSFILPSSSCPLCNQSIRWFDNIPILSFIILQAKCRNCHKSISFRYLTVEILSPLLMIVIIFNSESIKNIIIDYSFFSFLLLIFFIDLDHKIIPNSLTYTMAIIGIILNFFYFNFYEAIYSTFLGAFIGGVPILLLMYIFKKIRGVDGMGMGDIKLFIVLGIWLGWFGCLMVIFISSMLGSLLGIVGIMTNKVKFKQQLPFGPFIVIATVLYYFYKEEILGLLLI